MHRIIIADISCLILLSNINELDLLQKMYGNVFITEIIAEEFGEQLPEWIIIEQVNDLNKQKLLELQIDRGEASAITLAIENKNSTIIIDDYKARKIAEQLGINFTGTFGILLKAKNMQLIPLIKPILDKIKNTNFRISEELELTVLKLANEL
jgi:predicted nucleic acid-binding protein